jgi:hypothetical protein
MPCNANTGGFQSSKLHMDELAVAKLPEFQKYQYAFAAHIRDPKNTRRPAGASARRMGVYNELLYNNIESFLLACFPVLRKVLGSRRWTRLVRAFFSQHRSHTPYFRQIPDEFVQFLQNIWQPEEGYPDYLLELAHYEWIELMLSVSNRDEQLPEFDVSGDLIEGRPLLNPVLANLAYRYPVHSIRPRLKVLETPTCLLVFRDAHLQVRFMEQSPVSARLLALFEEGPRTGRQAVGQLASELGQENPDRLIEFARDYLEELRLAGAVLGTSR